MMAEALVAVSVIAAIASAAAMTLGEGPTTGLGALGVAILFAAWARLAQSSVQHKQHVDQLALLITHGSKIDVPPVTARAEPTPANWTIVAVGLAVAAIVTGAM